MQFIKTIFLIEKTQSQYLIGFDKSEEKKCSSFFDKKEITNIRNLKKFIYSI